MSENTFTFEGIFCCPRNGTIYKHLPHRTAAMPTEYELSLYVFSFILCKNIILIPSPKDTDSCTLKIQKKERKRIRWESIEKGKIFLCFNSYTPFSFLWREHRCLHFKKIHKQALRMLLQWIMGYNVKLGSMTQSGSQARIPLDKSRCRLPVKGSRDKIQPQNLHSWLRFFTPPVFGQVQD